MYGFLAEAGSCFALRFSFCCSWCQQSISSNPGLFMSLSRYQCFCVFCEINYSSHSLISNVWNLLFLNLLEGSFFSSALVKTDLLFGVLYMIIIACKENEVSFITNYSSWIALSKIITQKKKQNNQHFYHSYVKKSWNWKMDDV